MTQLPQLKVCTKFSLPQIQLTINTINYAWPMITNIEAINVLLAILISNGHGSIQSNEYSQLESSHRSLP